MGRKLFQSRWGAHMPDDDKPLTMTVPEAGKKYFGLSRDGSYRAAERGEIPTIRIGRLLRVPVRALERMLDQVDRTGADAP
jgi:excisionase family DNA binding protein